jgi:UDP-N-acetylmuramoyl-L-alanyl-D-glutamate--2,6-diaminopimelate ligase
VPEHARIIRYGITSRGPLTGKVDLGARRVEVDWEGTRVALEPSALVGSSPPDIALRAVGDVYAENALAALGGALAAGVSVEAAVARLGSMPPLPGRFEIVARAPTVIVDYAHSPDALERTVATARRLSPARLTVVFGAGGHRDRDKRPLMGAAAARADRIVLTSDNPRDEDPSEIARAIAEGIPGGCRVNVELDRARAIGLAIADSEATDVVLVAGRGHETDQIVGDRRIPLSDRDVVLDSIAENRTTGGVRTTRRRS